MPTEGPTRTSGRRRILAAVAAALAVPLAVSLPGPAASASHDDPKPKTTLSLYLDTTDRGTLYDEGCAAAGRVNRGGDPNKGLVLLFFGGPRFLDSGQSGASLYGGEDAPRLEIRRGAQSYVKGFYNCLTEAKREARGVRLRIAISTSNDFPSTFVKPDERTHGKEWASMVNAANVWLRKNGYAAKAVFRGGADIEPGFSGPRRARRWVNGYHLTGSAPLEDFGSADGCRSFTWGDVDSCNGTWTTEDIYDTAWASPLSHPVPEIYAESGVNAEQWVMISQWGVDQGLGPMDFRGPLTQRGACAQYGCVGTANTATQAWNFMVDAMDQRPDTIRDMAFSTDIRWLHP